MRGGEREARVDILQTCILHVERKDFVRRARGSVQPDSIDYVSVQRYEFRMVRLERLLDRVRIGYRRRRVPERDGRECKRIHDEHAVIKVGSTPMREFLFMF